MVSTQILNFVAKSHSLGTCRCARPPGTTIPGQAHCSMQILDFFQKKNAYQYEKYDPLLKKQVDQWFLSKRKKRKKWRDEMNILRNLAFCRKRNCKRKAYSTTTPFFRKPMSWQSNTLPLNIKNDGSHCKKGKKLQDDFMK